MIVACCDSAISYDVHRLVRSHLQYISSTNHDLGILMLYLQIVFTMTTLTQKVLSLSTDTAVALFFILICFQEGYSLYGMRSYFFLHYVVEGQCIAQTFRMG